MRKKTIIFWWILLIAGVAFMLYMFMNGATSFDYRHFLKPWVEFIRSHGHWNALAYQFSDYNYPYLYFLVLFSYLPGEPLLPIQIVSVAFQLLAGWYMGHIIALRYPGRKWTVVAGFALALAIPTATLNSVRWAQCDAIYSSLILGSIYFFMADKQFRSMALLGLAFAFKFQSIFIFPFYLVMLLTGRLRLKWIWVPIAVYLIALIPAIISGCSLETVLSVYTNQADQFKNRWMMLFANLYTMACGYNLIPRDGSVVWIWTLVAFAITFLGCLFVSFARKRSDHKDEKNFELYTAFLSLVFVPLVLPLMHDRYMFAGDLLSVVMIFYFPRLWPLFIAIPMVSLAFYIEYFWVKMFYSYLFNPLFQTAGFVYIIDVFVVIMYYIRMFLTENNCVSGIKGLNLLCPLFHKRRNDTTIS